MQNPPKWTVCIGNYAFFSWIVCKKWTRILGVGFSCPFIEWRNSMRLKVKLLVLFTWTVNGVHLKAGGFQKRVNVVTRQFWRMTLLHTNRLQSSASSLMTHEISVDAHSPSSCSSYLLTHISHLICAPTLWDVNYRLQSFYQDTPWRQFHKVSFAKLALIEAQPISKIHTWV